MRRLLLLAAVAAATAGQLPAQSATPLTKAAETITTEDVARHVHVLADDSMMGRKTPGRGVELAARYVADQFKKFGLKPGGENGTWFQRYPVPQDTTTAPNTVAIIEGSDPKLKHEYIVLSAHMDHVGFSRGQGGDSIYNGADDNASGTTGIIELAEAFSQPGARPRRSIIFLTVSGEERGYWGSNHFVKQPPVPLEQIVADINLDMVGRDWPIDTVTVIGAPFSDLGTTLTQAAAAHPELRLGLDVVEDFGPLLGGSDHQTFVRKNVPSLFFITGMHADYHAVSDSPEKIVAQKEARLLRLIFYLSYESANAAQRPQWNADGRQEVKQIPQ